MTDFSRTVLPIAACAGALGVLGVLVGLGAPAIEHAVAEAAAEAVAGSVVSAGVDGRSVVLTGRVIDEAERDAVLDRFSGLPVRLENRIEITPLARPFRMEVWRGSDGRVTMAGAMPAEPEDAGAIRAAVDAIPFATITDVTRPARGMPSDTWPETAARALSLLAMMETGEIILHDDRVGIVATFDSPRKEAAIRAAVLPGWSVELSPAPVLALARMRAQCAVGETRDAETVDLRAALNSAEIALDTAEAEVARLTARIANMTAANEAAAAAAGIVAADGACTPTNAEPTQTEGAGQ